MKLVAGKYAHFGMHDLPHKDSKLHRHAESPLHKAAENVLQGTEVQVANDKSVPAMDQWRRVLSETLSGGESALQSIDGVGERKKLRQMLWCLAEAKREITRQRLAAAPCVHISQDKRATRFLCRYQCCSSDLTIQTGILQLSRDVGTPECSGADGLRRATLKALEHACTPTKPPGHQAAQERPPIDRSAFDMLVKKVESYAADGASDEQLAGRELASSLPIAGPSVKELKGVLSQSLGSLKAPALVSHGGWRRHPGWPRPGLDALGLPPLRRVRL